ncbi:MAG: substrate-binding domain-containing protein [bacterium]|nr:substrate-binding domain-containing protein [bacterium]
MFALLVTLVVIEAIALVILVLVLIRSNLSYRRISSKADLIAKGKLDVEDIQVTGNKKNNATVLAGGFDSIKNNLLTFIEATKVNVITLSDAIDVLSRSVSANQAGNEQIADGVTTVAQKTAEQMELVEKNLELIESSNTQMQDINESVAQIKSRLDGTVQTSKQGIDDINGYSADMDTVAQELQDINGILDRFNEEIKQIEEVGDIIIGINNQLTLLAFNASIEAARAGEAGKGFTVVADEMNHMSAETKKGMGTIREILGEIIESSRQFNEGIQKCEEAFNQSKETFGSVSNSLVSINQQSFEIHSSVQAIADKTSLIADNAGELRTQADRLHNATQQITEKTHEIAAASEETAAESSQISENVEALNGMLGSIQGLLGQFNTSVLPTSKSGVKQVKIAFLTMLDNDFWFGVRKGVFYAEKELAGRNVSIDYCYFDNDAELPLREQVADKIQQCIREQYDGIIFAGFLDGTISGLKDAISRGIKVVAFNCDCSPEIKRMAVFSPDGRDAGELAGKCMERALNKKGNVALLTGDLNIQVNRDRRDGFMDKIASSKGIRVIDECAEKDVAELVYQRAVNLLNHHQDLDAIYVTSGLQATVARAIEDQGYKNKVITIGFDDNQEIFEYISKGIIYATVTQDPFGQGHDPIIWLYNHLVTGEPFPREFMGCRLSVVDRENVDNLLKA